MRVLAIISASLVLAGVAGATAPPIRHLPKGPSASMSTQRGQLVAVALPHVAGKSWRIARAPKPSVLRQVGEADVGKNVVVVFKAFGRGRATVVFGLTRGESPTATASRTFVVTVR